MPEGKPEPVIRELCKQIAAEENPGKLQSLVKSLQSSVEIEHDETRLIARHYRDRIRSAPLGPRMLDVISFLGLTPPRGKRSPENKLGENELKEKEHQDERQDKDRQGRTDAA
ncbi:MAG TPA: hypothetical protein VIH89_15360 [Candidatus Sulfotelmatobacter sp.]